MRLAFVTSQLPPDRPATGAAMADACILEALRTAGCEVRRFGFLRDDAASAPPPDAVVVARCAAPGRATSLLRKMGWLRDSARLGLPSAAARLAVADSGSLRAALAREGPFDGCVVSGSTVAAAFPWLFEAFPSLLLAHEVGHVAARERVAGAGLIDGAMFRRDAGLLRRFERTAIEAARFVWCLAEEDRGLFGPDIAGKSAVLPLVAGRGEAAAPATEAAPDIGLIGRWTCANAFGGLLWFLKRVAPSLPGDMTIAIAGDLPPGFRAPDARFWLAGDVGDPGAFITSCRCIALTSLAPTGILAEAVEVLQCGMPAVATPASVRGIGWLPMNCLVAEDPRAYAAALTKLVRDLRSERSAPTDGRAFVEAQQRGLRNGIAVGLAALRGRPGTR
jgi:hypothetical protein